MAEMLPTKEHKSSPPSKEEYHASFSKQVDSAKSAFVFVRIENGKEEVIELCIRRKGPINEKQTAKFLSAWVRSNSDGRQPLLPLKAAEFFDEQAGVDRT